MAIGAGNSESPGRDRQIPGVGLSPKREEHPGVRPSLSLVLLLIAVIVAGAGAGAWAFSRPAPRKIEIIIPTPGPITVHVTGAVASPGVYTLPPGARASDAIAAAGGLSEVSQVNLAAILHDGQQLVVTEMPAAGAPFAGNPTTSISNLIDLNSAGATELEQLPGIGPSRASAIVSFRERNGPIQYADDLTAIDGIGPSTVDAIRPLVVQP